MNNFLDYVTYVLFGGILFLGKITPHKVMKSFLTELLGNRSKVISSNLERAGMATNNPKNF